MSSETIETPSGKGAGDENFPVGSWLLPARLRPHVATFYRFARAIDDIADNPALTSDDKIARLERFAAAVTGEETADPALATAHDMRQSLRETGITPRHCLDLIAAFKQDALKRRYDDWGDLMAYCALSANPVGRYLLDLHDEDAAGYRASDALCSALQVLNHLQDCRDDYRALNRVYLPQACLRAHGADVRDLDCAYCTPGLRRVIDDCLDGVEELLRLARTLPGGLHCRSLAMESAVIVRLAERLSARLRGGDPVAGRVALTRLDFVLCGLRGAGGELLMRTFGGRRTGTHPARLRS
ncbi:MAG: squalene synthase HpnC [Alphaproteobacteria bacterium]|nr:MAG: squalene synthase HpnC [Alphaproteobacteria bacterium]